MSTAPSNPDQPVQPAGGWYPNLDGTGLPRAAVNAINQGFLLLYSLRDTVNQQKATMQKLVQYGTSRDRQNTKASTLSDGAIWIETDTGGKIYQVRYRPTTNDLDWVAIN